jgi:polysaccharide export outer membrane protein
LRKLALCLIIYWVILGFWSIAQGESYLLAPRDVISISIWGGDEFQVKDVTIRPDGRISVPLAGEMQAAGLPADGLSQMVQTALQRYIKNPVVTINIEKYHTTRVYVFGEVAKPGLYEIERQHNVLDAIGIAGGYTKYAAKKKIFIIRKGHTRDEDMIRVNLLQMLNKGDTTQNYSLNEGDVLFITNNGKITFYEDVLPWITAAFQIKTGFNPVDTYGKSKN